MATTSAAVECKYATEIIGKIRSTLSSTLRKRKSDPTVCRRFYNIWHSTLLKCTHIPNVVYGISLVLFVYRYAYCSARQDHHYLAIQYALLAPDGLIENGRMILQLNPHHERYVYVCVCVSACSEVCILMYKAGKCKCLLNAFETQANDYLCFLFCCCVCCEAIRQSNRILALWGYR